MKEKELENLYPKYKCPTCKDWYHMPFKYCKCEEMKENEPKVKDSDKAWEKLMRSEMRLAEIKPIYDRLVTLEAKIELLNLFTKHYDDGERFLGFLEDHESELAELVKELKI